MRKYGFFASSPNRAGGDVAETSTAGASSCATSRSVPAEGFLQQGVAKITAKRNDAFKVPRVGLALGIQARSLLSKRTSSSANCFSIWGRSLAIVPGSGFRLGSFCIPMKRLSFLVAVCVICSCKGSTGEKSGSDQTTTPQSAKTHAGSTGVVKGIVRIRGDEPPELPAAADIPVGKCFKAHERHRLLFRKAEGGGVADAVVAVTGYEGLPPMPTSPVVVGMEDCSLAQRTIVLTMGQSIHVKNRGPSAGMPQLVGLPTPAVMAAVPGGDPVVLTPHAPGRFQLIDHTHPFASADVFVVSYPTITVSDEKGRFEIAGIPVGTAKVSVRLPATGLTSEKTITVEAGKPTEVEFELQFDRAKHEAAIELGKRLERGEESPASAPSQ